MVDNESRSDVAPMKQGIRLLIRADASVAIGTGHVMRCLALAQAWQDAGGEVAFVMAEPMPAIRERLVSEKMQIVPLEVAPGGSLDARWTGDLARRLGAVWIAVDGYHFGAEYQRELKSAGVRVLFVDDNGHSGSYAADLVLNQNVYADESLYEKREPQTRLLLGSRYAMLRREFQSWREWKRTLPAVGEKVLVSMGGSDPGNATLVAISVLRAIKVDEFEVLVIAGGSNPHLDSLERAVRESRGRFRLTKDVTDMAPLLAWADVMLAAAGSICWEICAMAVPSILVVTAPNQVLAARRLAELGAAVSLSGPEEIATGLSPLLKNLIESHGMRQELSLRAGRLVDMDGAARVVQALQGLE